MREEIKNYLNYRIDMLRAKIGYDVQLFIEMYADSSNFTTIDSAIHDYLKFKSSLETERSLATFYNFHQELCDEAMRAYDMYDAVEISNYFDNHTLADYIVLHGKLGYEYSIETEICMNRHTVCLLLLLNYILNNENELKLLNKDIINDIIDNGDFTDVDTFDKLHDWKHTFITE